MSSCISHYRACNYVNIAVTMATNSTHTHQYLNKHAHHNPSHLSCQHSLPPRHTPSCQGYTLDCHTETGAPGCTGTGQLQGGGRGRKMVGGGGRGWEEEEVVMGEGEEVEEEEVVEEEECKGRIYHGLCRTCSQHRFLFWKTRFNHSLAVFFKQRVVKSQRAVKVSHF